MDSIPRFPRHASAPSRARDVHAPRGDAAAANVASTSCAERLCLPFPARLHSNGVKARAPQPHALCFRPHRSSPRSRPRTRAFADDAPRRSALSFSAAFFSLVCFGMHHEQPRRSMLLPLRACCPSLQSPCLCLTATLVFFSICAFHVHRSTASHSLPFGTGLHKLVLPGSLHASDPPLASPVDARSVAHHARAYGDAAFSHHLHRAPLYSTLQSSPLHALAPNLLRDRTPRALMRSSDRLYPVESHPIPHHVHNRFPLESERAKYLGDDHNLASRTEGKISDSLYLYPTQPGADAARDSIHQSKQHEPVEQQARRHPVIQAFNSIIGASPVSKTLDTDTQSSSQNDLHPLHSGTELTHTSQRPASVSVSDLAASTDGAQAVLEPRSEALVETDSEKTLHISEEQQLQHGRMHSSSSLSPEAHIDEAAPMLRETAGVDSPRVEAEAKLEVPAIASDEQIDEKLNDAPKESGFLSFLWGSSRSKEELPSVEEEKEPIILNSAVKKDERASYEEDVNVLAAENIEKDNEVEAS